MTPLTILVAALVILVVDYLAEKYIRAAKRSKENDGETEPTFDWLSNPLRKH